jgi:hypothetical protein
MSRGKTGVLVLIGLAAMFFIFIAILFGSSTKRQAAINRITALNDRCDLIAEQDITIYWIGSELPSDLEHMAPAVSLLSYEGANRETLPIKTSSFHITEYNEDGDVIAEQVPREYPRYMMIVITGNPVMSDSGKEALRDAITQNGVPVLAIGDEASEFVSGILMYSRFKSGPDSSFYYCLGAGYTENPIPEEKVAAGGFDLAEAVPDLVSLAMTDFKPQY